MRENTSTGLIGFFFCRIVQTTKSFNHEKE